MRESCTYGSVRGASSNGGPYRNQRREFVAGLGAAAWPLLARAQQSDRVRRIGVLMGSDETDAEKTQLAGLTQGLAELGWTDGRNVMIDIRWTDANADRIRLFAKELVELQPEVIVAHSTPVAAGLQRATRTTPIVFVQVSDPVGDGFVASLSRPGGNMTGFINHEDSIAGKWVQLLREVAPSIKRIAAIFNPDTAPGGGSVAPSSRCRTAISLITDL
jgi:putative tryptophan/tyrosine transport system substrate-binding protein